MLLNKKIYAFGLMILFCFVNQHSVNGMKQNNSRGFGEFCAEAWNCNKLENNKLVNNKEEVKCREVVLSKENNKVVNFMEKLGRWSGKLLTKAVKYSLPPVPKEGVCSKKFLLICLLYGILYFGVLPNLGLVAGPILEIISSGCTNLRIILGFALSLMH
jgi:hypothetical protein